MSPRKSKAGSSGSEEAQVGGRLRQLRSARRMSLRELARRSGVSANALSMIERGLSSPSVGTLFRLAEGLGIPIASVFTPLTTRHEVVFRRAEERTRMGIPVGTWEGLGGEEFVGQVQPFVIRLEPGGASGSDAIVHTGHEFVLCLRGQLEYTIEHRRFDLDPGDSLLFAARLQHAWRNRRQEPAEALILLAGFEEHDRPHELHLPQEPRSTAASAHWPMA